MPDQSARQAAAQRRRNKFLSYCTPSTTLSQQLLAAVAGTITIFCLWIAVISLATPAFTILFGGAAALTGILAVHLLRAASSTDTAETVPSSDEETEPTPLELLKRQYARGRISEEEFEQRAETLLDLDAQTPSRGQSVASNHTDEGRIPELDRA